MGVIISGALSHAMPSSPVKELSHGQERIVVLKDPWVLSVKVSSLCLLFCWQGYRWDSPSSPLRFQTSLQFSKTLGLSLPPTNLLHTLFWTKSCSPLQTPTSPFTTFSFSYVLLLVSLHQRLQHIIAISILTIIIYYTLDLISHTANSQTDYSISMTVIMTFLTWSTTSMRIASIPIPKIIIIIPYRYSLLLPPAYLSPPRRKY